MYFEYLPVLYNKARGSVCEKQTKNGLSNKTRKNQ